MSWEFFDFESDGLFSFWALFFEAVFLDAIIFPNDTDPVDNDLLGFMRPVHQSRQIQLTEFQVFNVDRYLIVQLKKYHG